MPTPSPARMHDFTVVSNEPLADGVFSLVIEAPRLASALQPGQFVNIRVPGNAMSLLRIPLSYASADPAAGAVEIWYAVVGDGTARMSKWTPGFKGDLLGPGGHGWCAPEGCRRALLVGGGIGVPPVLCLGRDLAARGVPFDACIGAATAGKLVGASEFAEAGCGVLRVCTDDGSGEGAHHGFVTDPVAELLASGEYDYVATCGPAPMMKRVADLAADHGVFCEASLERMMSCGFGACSTCNVETVEGMKGACMCGPVFDATKVVAW